MKPYHKKRLRKLIAFLRAMPRKDFYFGAVVKEAKANGHVCGTVCCAIGWTPAVFPALTKWVIKRKYVDTPNLSWIGNTVRMVGGRAVQFPTIGAILFGMKRHTSERLFSPHMQSGLHPELYSLPGTATPKQFARTLERFLALVEKGKIKP